MSTAEEELFYDVVAVHFENTKQTYLLPFS